MTTIDNNQLVDNKTAAEILQISHRTLMIWRSSGRYGIPYIKIGTKVRYKRGDLQAWLDSRYNTTGFTKENS
jgi:excisionase family DNA binding protein